ncbi:uncharacterized protein LOC122259337 [Penaeus japonicus]|uniref:uncharacterized protein LOC122254531 n=1 Tax=Penaeus japonicus TaxID=27405 RepID=UPI001C7140EB|nr:uncharacterized protein LOC122254531 [Penaeus japonicus]XP_042881994.1 uncharacterized protein LOC122259337 [Penaeus japonicus]
MEASRPPRLQIRGNYDEETIVVYQAYKPAIGEAALAAGHFVEPFSLNRMTWIKPSFLWMMERCGWGEKKDQEVVLGIRITRAGWEEALSNCVLSHPIEGVYKDRSVWLEAKKKSTTMVQWDPERDIFGNKLSWRSIQVGISKDIITSYAKDWIKEITDMRPLIKDIKDLMAKGKIDEAHELLPKEREYPLSEDLAKRLAISDKDDCV